MLVTNKDKKSSPVKPYDDSIWDHWLIYEDITYTRDNDLCDYLSLNSGNVIKFYRCLIKESYELKN